MSKPEVLFREINGKKCEPMEAVTIDVPEEFVGKLSKSWAAERAEMTNMYPAKGGYTRLEFSIPARGLIGYRSEFMTDTKGNGIMNSLFDGYEPYKGDIVTRRRALWLRLKAAKPSPMVCITRRNVGSCSSAQAQRFTRAWLSAEMPVRMIWISTYVRKSS